MPTPYCDLSFSDLICSYNTIQSNLTVKVKSLADKSDSAQPGMFILLQFEMSKVAQVGDTISNLIAQVQSMIMTSIRSQKSQ